MGVVTTDDVADMIGETGLATFHDDVVTDIRALQFRVAALEGRVDQCGALFTKILSFEDALQERVARLEGRMCPTCKHQCAEFCHALGLDCDKVGWGCHGWEAR